MEPCRERKTPLSVLHHPQLLRGVARKTRETIVLCEAAGFDTVFVETVGVGQSETAVHSMVDFFLLIQLAGTGDELQGIKRGIMEMADGIIINKADGDNIEKANLAAAQFRNALHLSHLRNRLVPESIDLFRLLQPRYQRNMGYDRRVHGVHQKERLLRLQT